MRCPRNLNNCKPLSFLQSDCKTSCVCLGVHNEKKIGHESGDIYRHCFYNQETDTMFDYDEYDLLSILSVITNGMLINNLKNK